MAKKLSKNLTRVAEKQKADYLKSEAQLASVGNFRSFFRFLGLLSSGLKLHLQPNLAKFDQAIRTYLDWFARSFQQ